MGIVPDSRIGKIEFYEAHLTPWGATPTAIGLTAAKVTALSETVTAARDAYNEAVGARDAAKAATTKFYNAVRTMHSDAGMGSDMIETIKTYALTTDNPDVYAIAQIPPPATPGTTPPPGTPFEFTVGLLQSGALELKWKCSNPSGTVGTIYEVMRKVGSGAFTFVGATGVKLFTDETLPAGASPTTYRVTAVRSTSRGNPSQFTVTFGVDGPGIVGENAGLQIAA